TNRLIVINNDRGVGIGKFIIVGFGLVLDGRERVDNIIKSAMPWDVMGGVARRAWARNENSINTCIEYNEKHKDTDHITIPYVAKDILVKELVEKAIKKN